MRKLCPFGRVSRQVMPSRSLRHVNGPAEHPEHEAATVGSHERWPVPTRRLNRRPSRRDSAFMCPSRRDGACKV